MLTAARALTLTSQSAPELPRVDGLTTLYRSGVRPRMGEVIMIAGQSGSQKSGFALWWAINMGLPTLYFSADMSPFQASVRVACSVTGESTEEVEEGMRNPVTRDYYIRKTSEIPITFAFGSPIKARAIEAELDAYVELHNAYPQVIVIDNLMDMDGAAADYTAQMDAMQSVSELSRFTKSTVIVLHHASDKSWSASADPWHPPSRDQIKGGMSEKPELSLSVALDPTQGVFNIACIKQRMGRSDPTAKSYVTLDIDPASTRFFEKGRKPLRTP